MGRNKTSISFPQKTFTIIMSAQLTNVYDKEETKGFFDDDKIGYCHQDDHKPLKDV